MPVRIRVIAGSAGGLFLQSPKKHQLRPTQDRIRQVIFSSLGDRVIGARVLDLYAGTGALGIEALSRGAARAVFVEQDAEAVSCIKANLLHCHLQGEVRKQSVDDFLKVKPAEPEYDLIFADPPYIKEYKYLDLTLLSVIFPHLVGNGYVVWEHFAGQKAECITGWEMIRDRSYGETGLTFYAKR